MEKVLVPNTGFFKTDATNFSGVIQHTETSTFLHRMTDRKRRSYLLQADFHFLSSNHCEVMQQQEWLQISKQSFI